MTMGGDHSTIPRFTPLSVSILLCLFSFLINRARWMMPIRFWRRMLLICGLLVRRLHGFSWSVATSSSRTMPRWNERTLPLVSSSTYTISIRRCANCGASTTSLNVGSVEAYPVNSTDPNLEQQDTSTVAFLGNDWRQEMGAAYNPYRSKLLQNEQDWDQFLESLTDKQPSDEETPTNVVADPFWEQIRLEAKRAVRDEPQAGPQIYQGILSQPLLLVAVVTVVAHQLETELISAVQLKNLFLSLLTTADERAMRLDLHAVATRSPSVQGALSALMFHNGFHALTAYRVSHQLWLAGRKGLAYYLQSVVSRKYSADIHPASRLGDGIYLRVGAGVVIGETAVVGNDVSILEGVTLGGTGKESGDRHPKVGNGVIIYDGGTVLGNILVGDGAVVTAKSIVTKPVPPLAIVAGVPAKITKYRTLQAIAFEDDLQEHLWHKYVEEWKLVWQEIELEIEMTAQDVEKDG